MPLTPLLTSLTIVLVTRALLTPIRMSAMPWVRAVAVMAIQAFAVFAPIVTSANWWIIVMIIVAVDTTHIALLSSTRNVPLAHLLSFGLTVILLAAAIGAPSLVPSYNAFATAIAQRVTRRNAILSSITPEVFHYLAVTLAGLWIAGVEANHPIALILKRSHLMPADTIKRSARGLAAGRIRIAATGPSFASTEPARGRMIGILERMIVLVLTLTGNLSALGLVLAAKAIARFKDLDKRDFAEYVLIGTLMSITAALLGGLLLKTLL